MTQTKRCLFMIGSVALLLTGCGNKNNVKTEIPEVEKETTIDEGQPQTNEKLSGLIENEDPDIEVTAAVLERKAILPGSTIPLAVKITNNGNNKIVYVLGSGSFETPQAIFMDIPKLQPILPKDYLGAATMDMQYKELLPGETIEYTQYIRVITPSDKFDEYAYDKWQKDQMYIADMEWETLNGEYSDLTLASTGSYDGNVYFAYYIEDATQETPPANATGYSVGKFTIGVTE